VNELAMALGRRNIKAPHGQNVKEGKGGRRPHFHLLYVVFVMLVEIKFQRALCLLPPSFPPASGCHAILHTAPLQLPFFSPLAAITNWPWLVREGGKKGKRSCISVCCFFGQLFFFVHIRIPFGNNQEEKQEKKGRIKNFIWEKDEKGKEVGGTWMNEEYLEGN
jgi:hypothetical protein